MIRDNGALPEERRGGHDHDSVHDDESPAGASSAQSFEPELLKISRDGPLAVVVFPRVRMHNDTCIENYRRQLYELLEDSACQRLKFDVTGIPVIPSALLGLLVSVMKRGCAIELYNPSAHVRETLEITRLDSIIALTGPDA